MVDDRYEEAMSILHNLAMGLLCSLLLSAHSICGSDSAMVANLRSQLKYKFVLDFLIKQKPEIKYEGEELVRRMAGDLSYFENES